VCGKRGKKIKGEKGERSLFYNNTNVMVQPNYIISTTIGSMEPERQKTML
jgi:hypothetical protein